MKITQYCLRRPITTVMFFIALMILGIVSMYRLPLEFMPKADFPELDIQIPYPASSPDEVNERIIKPIEEAISTLPGIEKIVSRASINGAFMHVSFKSGSNVDYEVLEIREKIDIIRDELPQDLDFIWIWKYDSESIPIFILGVYAQRYEPEINDLVDQKIARELRKVDGVANVELWGEEQKRVLVEVDREKLNQYGIRLLNVFQAIVTNNLTLDAGQVLHNGKRYDIRVVGQAVGPDEIRNFPITEQVKIGDVAEVRFDYTFGMFRGRIDRQRAYIILVRKESGSNTVQVCRQVRKVLERVLADPALTVHGIKTRVFFDQSQEITKAISGLRASGIQGGILAALVLFLLLRNLASTLIICLAIPTSIVIAIIAMHLGLGMSFNMISLSGLMLGIGMLVDNSIVVMEAIYSKMQEGINGRRAALEGAKEVGLAIAVSTTTTLIVFLPLVFAAASESVVIMREFGIVLCLSISASLFVALTLIPLLAGWLLSSSKAKVMGTPSWFLSFHSFYMKTMQRALKRRRRAVLIFVAFFVLTFIPALLIEREFIPDTALRIVRILVKFERALAIEDIDKVVDSIEAKLWRHKDDWGVETMAAFFNKDFVEINLILPEYDPKLSRNTVKELVKKYLAKEANYPGVSYDLETMGFEGPVSGGLSVRVLGDDPQVLMEYAERMRERLKTIPELTDVKPIAYESEKELSIYLDRELAKIYDVDITQAGYEIAYGIRGVNAGWVQHQDKQVDIVMQLKEEHRNTLTAVKNYPISNREGKLIPLGSFAKIASNPVPRAIRRENRRTAVRIPIEYSQKDLFTLKKKIASALEGFSLPRGYAWTMSDEFDKVRDAFITLLEAIALAIVLVFIIMVAQFESFFLPFVIMFSMPFAVIGVYWGLFITGNTMNVLSGAGMLLLAGIVVNNAIVLVDHINNLRKKGLDKRESLVKAASDRLRPIMMTGATTLVGLFPMALGANDQGRLIYSPLAIAVLGGIFTSTTLVPILIPVIYSYSDDAVETIKQKLTKIYLAFVS